MILFEWMVQCAKKGVENIFLLEELETKMIRQFHLFAYIYVGCLLSACSLSYVFVCYITSMNVLYLLK